VKKSCEAIGLQQNLILGILLLIYGLLYPPCFSYTVPDRPLSLVLRLEYAGRGETQTG